MRLLALSVPLLLSGCALFAVPLPSLDPSMRQLAPLEGCWAGFHAGATIEECWGRPAAGAMLGNSRTLVAGRTSSFEYLLVEKRGEETYYVAMPHGAGTTEFKLVPSDPFTLVFENAAHDFPRRIIYFVSNSVLGVRLEGVEDGAARVVEYTLKRQ